MFQRIVLVAITMFLITPHMGHALECYECFACGTPVKVHCNETSVKSINQAASSIFDEISTEKSEKFDCITLAYLNDDSHAKLQGCVYNSYYACTLKPHKSSVVYICGTCDTDLCNFSPGLSDTKIVFTILATIFSTAVARIL